MKLVLLLLGAFLLFFLQRYIYQTYWKKQLTVSIRFQEQPVFEGESACLTEIIENRKLLPLIHLNVKFQISRYLQFQNMENTTVSDQTYRSDIFSVLFFQRITRTLQFHCQKRGYYEIKQADCISSDLLMTNSLVTILPVQTFLYVYPKSIDISSLEVPFRKMIGSITSRQFLYEDPFEFRGIRDYTITDPMNKINWKASARSGNLMVNLHDSTASQEVILFLNLEDPLLWKKDILQEVSIRLAGAISQYFLNKSIPIQMVCNAYDLLTGQVAVIPAGTGLCQITTIYQILARIDLSRPTISCKQQLQDLLYTSNRTDPLYIMISSDLHPDLQEAFGNLTQNSAGALWIAPLTADMEFPISSTPDMQVIRWEVSSYET